MLFGTTSFTTKIVNVDDMLHNYCQLGAYFQYVLLFSVNLYAIIFQYCFHEIMHYRTPNRNMLLSIVITTVSRRSDFEYD